MAKETKKKKGASLEKVAKEMNDVMQYGLHDETGEIDEDQLIDVELDEDELLDVIKDRAAEDLRPNDEESFSEDVWQWFIDNGITPSDSDDGNIDDGPEDEEDEEDEAPAPKSKKDKKPVKEEKKPAGKKKAAKEEPEDEDEEDEKPKKKSGKKGNAPGLLAGAIKGNEKIAMDIVEEGGDLDDVVAEFTKIYKKAGKDDKAYISKRSQIYYNIAVKRLTEEGKIEGKFVGKVIPKKKAKDDDDEPAPKKSKKPEQKASQKLAKKK